MRTHDVVRDRRRGRVSARLLAGMAAVLLLAGCGGDRTSPSAPQSAGDPLVERLVAMGFPREGIVDRGDYFMVQGDIRITKAELRAMRPVSGPRTPGAPSYQRYGTTVASNRRTIRVDLSAIDAEDATWAAATRAAMGNWSGVSGAGIVYVEGSPADVTITMYSNSTDCTAASSSFPTSGAPGPTLVINRSYSGSYTLAKRTWIMTHELGHTFGLMHTDQGSGTLVPGTNTSDAASVMNSGSTYGGCPPAAPSWSSFSTGDLTAVRWLYPGLSVSLSGKQNVALHESAPYTATTTNGTAPYNFEWRSRQTGPSTSGTWSSWFSTGTSNVTYASINSCGLNTNYLESRVTDATGKQVTASYVIYITNPC